jgi:hypothetical protein
VKEVVKAGSEDVIFSGGGCQAIIPYAYIGVELRSRRVFKASSAAPSEPSCY